MSNKDSRLLNWDPESIEQYWNQCREFDAQELIDGREAESHSIQAWSESSAGIDE